MTAVTRDVLALLPEGLSDRAGDCAGDRAGDRPLIGRIEEQRVLAGLVAGVQEGLSGALVLVGEPGTGKTRLLDQAATGCPDVRVARIVGVESEAHLGFAALHRLLRPWSSRIESLPTPQRDALRSAFGQVAAVAADRYLVGMAALTLLADAASVQPLLCVVEDVQWLDRESAEALAFVARRLHAEAVGLLFAIRPRSDGLALFDGLPVMTVSGLPVRDAGRLLSTSAAGRLDDAVAATIVTGTGGNPLALIELARTLTAEQLSGRAPCPAPFRSAGSSKRISYSRSRPSPPTPGRCSSSSPPRRPETSRCSGGPPVIWGSPRARRTPRCPRAFSPTMAPWTSGIR
ncbi:hypothetical protein GCM10027612_01340 [Microbispora bryophytorum subsp. camponoti]